MFCNHLDREERPGRFTLIVCVMSGDSWYSVGLSHGVVRLSAVCHCGISWSYLLFLYLIIISPSMVFLFFYKDFQILQDHVIFCSIHSKIWSRCFTFCTLEAKNLLMAFQTLYINTYYWFIVFLLLYLYFQNFPGVASFVDHFCYLWFVFVMFSCLFIVAMWSPAWKELTSWFICMWCLLCFCQFPMKFSGSGVVLDCIDSWYLLSFFLSFFDKTMSVFVPLILKFDRDFSVVLYY